MEEVLKNRNIQTISTIHNAKLINTNKIDGDTQLRFKKPHCVDYNKCMSGVLVSSIQFQFF